MITIDRRKGSTTLDVNVTRPDEVWAVETILGEWYDVIWNRPTVATATPKHRT